MLNTAWNDEHFSRAEANTAMHEMGNDVQRKVQRKTYSPYRTLLHILAMNFQAGSGTLGNPASAMASSLSS